MKTYWLITGFLLLTVPLTSAQDTLTLKECYKAALENYPLNKQKGLLTQSGDLAIANLKASRWLPQFTVNGQATWQSEVTKLPLEFPGIQVPELSRDQYKLTLDAGYTLYDGEANRLERELQKATTNLEIQQVEVELNRLKQQVNVYFLNALLAEENSKLIQTSQSDLKNRIDKLSANARYGTVAQTTVDALQAEYLQTEQKLAELLASRKGFKDMLAILTGLPVLETTPLQVGTEEANSANITTTHPQQKVFELQRTQVDIHKGFTSSKLQPRVSAFAQTGVGRPGLNFLNNDFRSFFLGGVRLSWNISSGYNLKRERTILSIREQMITNQQESFQQSLSLSLRQQQIEIDRFEALLEKDRQIVALRSKLKQSASTQLENGAIAARDYISEVNAENQALLNLHIHQLQWQMAKLQYVTLTGN